MVYIFILLIIFVLWILYMVFEAFYFQIVEVKHSEISGLKLMQLSDIHINLLKISAKRVRAVIEKTNPDIIIITGDYIDSISETPKFLDYLREINFKNNIYLCMGNHDYNAVRKTYNGMKTFIEVIEKTGVKVLHNSSTSFIKDDKEYKIIGFDDIKETKGKVWKGHKETKGAVSTTLAISHNPDIVLALPTGSVDYLFCGHFHGGQIWAPFDIEYRLLRKDKLCKMGIRKGLHKVNGINLYISRGLGNVIVPLRFLSRPEITIHYLP